MRLALTVFVSALAVGCAGTPPTGLAASLPGTTWTVERVVGADGSVLRSENAEVTFGADGDLRLSSCNQCGGSYRIEDDVLQIEEALACTRRACLPGQLELERYVTGPLALQRDGAYLVMEPTGEAAGAQVLLVPSGAARQAPASGQSGG